MLRTSKDVSWYGFACAFVDLKWPRVAATTRRTHAEALTAVTTAMFTSTRGQPSGKLLRAALKRWAFNRLFTVEGVVAGWMVAGASVPG
jgi:hypothetical protein